MEETTEVVAEQKTATELKAECFDLIVKLEQVKILFQKIEQELQAKQQELQSLA